MDYVKRDLVMFIRVVALGFALFAGYSGILYGGALFGFWMSDPPPFGVAALGCLWLVKNSLDVAFAGPNKPLDTPETKPLSNP